MDADAVVTQLLHALFGGPSRDAYVEWAYGQTKSENDDVTREMAEDAVARMFGERP